MDDAERCRFRGLASGPLLARVDANLDLEKAVDSRSELPDQKRLFEHYPVLEWMRNARSAITTGEQKRESALDDDLCYGKDVFAGEVDVQDGEVEGRALRSLRASSTLPASAITRWPSSSTMSAIIIRMIASSSTSNTSFTQPPIRVGTYVIRSFLDLKLFSGIDDAHPRIVVRRLAALHGHFKLDRKAQTERSLRPISNPCTTMIRHMTGRLLQRRLGYEIDIEKVLKACANNDVAV